MTLEKTNELDERWETKPASSSQVHLKVKL